MVIKNQLNISALQSNLFFIFSIEPNILLSTSNDLRVKLYSAENGEYIDELKQISNKFNPVPIGIKYTGTDPINSKIKFIFRGSIFG